MILSNDILNKYITDDLEPLERDLMHYYIVGAAGHVIINEVSVEKWEEICQDARNFVKDRRVAIGQATHLPQTIPSKKEDSTNVSDEQQLRQEGAPQVEPSGLSTSSEDNQ